MVHKEAGEDTLTPELIAEIDKLVPPQTRSTRLVGLLLVVGAMGFLAWGSISNAIRATSGHNELVHTSLSYPSSFDEERGLMSVRGQLLARKNTVVQVVDLTIDAPGAELVEFELESNADPADLPFDISQEDDLLDSVTLDYTAWLAPQECQTSSEWGVVTITFRDEAGELSQIESRPYTSYDTIPRELRSNGVDLLEVACEVLR